MRRTLFLLMIAASGCGRAAPADPDSGVDGAPGVDSEPRPDGTGADYSRVYAHSGTTLYRIETSNLEVIEVGPFGAATGTQSITDIAIDRDDRMIGVSLDAIYEIDETTGTATHLADFAAGVDGFTSLSFVPVDPDDDQSAERLVAANDQGAVFEIDPVTGAATQIGSYGMSGADPIRSSGDIVSVRGFGTLATVTIGLPLTEPDHLAWIDPVTWEATIIGAGSTGYDRIFGLGFWGGTIFGFVDDGSAAGTGQMVTIDPTTGVATPATSAAFRWYGAGVTTDAPIVN